MNAISTVTPKGQVTIPIEFRQQYDIHAFQKVEFTNSPKGIVLRPIKNFLELGGSIHIPRKNLNKNKNKLLKEKRKKLYEEKELRSR